MHDQNNGIFSKIFHMYDPVATVQKSQQRGVVGCSEYLGSTAHIL